MYYCIYILLCLFILHLSLFIYVIVLMHDDILSLMHRQNTSSDVKNNACTASGSSAALSLTQESTLLSPANTAMTTNAILTPSTFSWSPALYQHTHGKYYCLIFLHLLILFCQFRVNKEYLFHFIGQKPVLDIAVQGSSNEAPSKTIDK